MKRIECRARGSRVSRWLATAVVSLGVWSCASGGGGASGGAAPGRTEDRPAPVTYVESEARVLAVHLASNRPTQAIPVIRRDTDDRLQLSFDVAGDRREFYTAHFHPATQNWQVTDTVEEGILPPPDDITDYQTSTDLDFPYVQYRYEFPNPRIDFYRSGHFVLQVLNDTDQILLERRFYVSDDILDVEVVARSSSLITDRPDELIPEARVVLPNDPWFSPSDCSVRFIKNGWTDQFFQVGISRVEGDAYVFEAPRAFRLTVPVFNADLRGITGIHHRDEITVPVTISLLPDDMRFWGDDYRLASPLPRQIALPNPSIRYVRTRFFVRNGPRGDAPYLVGSFNDWEISKGYQLEWNQPDNSYEIELPLREEKFFYTYAWRNPDAVRPQSKFEGPEEVVFTAILYAKDQRYPTDRILAVKSQTLPDSGR